MARRKPLHQLIAFFALSIACQPATIEASEQLGESVTLTADAPVAAFEVNVCLEGGAPANLSVYGSFFATVTTSEGEVEFTLESLESPESESSPYVHTATATPSGDELSIALLTDRDWDASGRRCQTQTVQLSVPSLDETQTVTISDLRMTGTAEWSGFCGPSPDDGDLTLDAVRL